MASIRQRGNRFQVQIRHCGLSIKTKSFTTLVEAQKWAAREEARFENEPVGPAPSDRLKDILLRYLVEITPSKKGAPQERYRISRLLKDDLAEVPLKRLTGGILAAFRDRRLRDGVRACQYDLVIIRHALEIARKEWGYFIAVNPVSEIKVPNGVRRRERRLTKQEADRFSVALSQCWNPTFRYFILFAIETAMRRSELLGMRWIHVDYEADTVLLEDTKNGESRTVPLTRRARSLLDATVKVSDAVFPLQHAAIRSAWLRLLNRGKITNFRFHDLRHEAISRLFELGLTIPEVALISGHKDPKTLFRYTHLRAETVGRKLQSLEQSITSD